MSDFTIARIAEGIGAQAVGDTSFMVRHAAEPAEAGPNDLAMAMSPKYAEQLRDGSARAAVLWCDADWRSFGLSSAILVDRPRFAMARITNLLSQVPVPETGIHPSAVIEESAMVAPDAAVGALTYIGAEAEIAANVVIGAGSVVAAGSKIGADSVLMERVVVGHGVTIGERFVAQPGAIIGGDGFSFVTPERSAVENVRATLGERGDVEDQKWVRIHSLGGVEIGDDVEVGAGSAVDRGTIRATRIGRGTKIDNLVQIGHNVVIGEDVLICAQVGVAGSTRVGHRVVLGGQAGLSDNITVGDDVVVGAAAKVLSNAPAGRVLMGYPAMKMDTFFKISRNLRRLPALVDSFRELRSTQKGTGK